jgi:hypothetical protein
VLPALSPTLKMKAADSSETLASVYPTKSLHISKDYNLQMSVEYNALAKLMVSEMSDNNLRTKHFKNYILQE